MRFADVFIYALLLVFLLQSGLTNSQMDSGVVIIEAAVAVLNDLTVSPSQVNRGGTVDFSLYVENKGNLQTTLQANITLKNSTNDQVGLIEFNSVILSPGETAVFMSSWSTGTLPIGDYTANAAGLYDAGLPTNSLQEPFSIVVPAAPTGGGRPPLATPAATPVPPEEVVLPEPLPEKIKPEVGVIRFTKKTVLKEILAGEGSVESITLKNTGRETQQVSISVSGVPPGFVSPQQEDVVLLPGRSAVVNLAFSIPKDALTGDYLAKIVAGNEKTYSEEYLVVRVKSALAEYDQPITLKTVSIDERTKTTRVRLSIRNPSFKRVEILQLFEQMPSSLASDPSQITFSERVGVVISREPLVLVWELKDLQPGETLSVSYLVDTFLNEYSTYAYWPVRQVVFSTEKAKGLLKIQELNAPVMTAGEPSTVDALLFYGGLTSLPVTIFLEVPSKQFTVTPESRQLVLAPRSLTPVSFEVTPLDVGTLVEGSHVAALVVSSQDASIRQATLFVVQVPPALVTGMTVGLVAIVAALVALAVFLFTRKRKGDHEKSLRKELMEERDGYLREVKDSVMESE